MFGVLELTHGFDPHRYVKSEKQSPQTPTQILRIVHAGL